MNKLEIILLNYTGKEKELDKFDKFMNYNIKIIKNGHKQKTTTFNSYG